MGGSDAGIWVTSGRYPDGEASCKITWDGQEWIAPVEDIRVTALDLVTCAAYAEMMMKLIDLGLPPQHVTAFTTDLLSDAGRRMFGTEQAITVMPAGSSKRRQPLVLLKHGPLKGSVSPAEARGMALGRLEAAEASESDQLVSEALRATGIADVAAQGKLFGYLRSLRSGDTTGDGR